MLSKLKKNQFIYREIIDELELTGIVTPNQARKKWNYLWGKYTVCFESFHFLRVVISEFF